MNLENYCEQLLLQRSRAWRLGIYWDCLRAAVLMSNWRYARLLRRGVKDLEAAIGRSRHTDTSDLIRYTPFDEVKRRFVQLIQVAQLPWHPRVREGHVPLSDVLKTFDAWDETEAMASLLAHFNAWRPAASDSRARGSHGLRIVRADLKLNVLPGGRGDQDPDPGPGDDHPPRAS